MMRNTSEVILSEEDWRIISGGIETKFQNITIIEVYALTNNAEEEKKKVFYH